MKVSRELADVLKETSKEVESWPQWKRSLDPIGDKPTRTDEEGSQSDEELREAAQRVVDALIEKLRQALAGGKENENG